MFDFYMDAHMHFDLYDNRNEVLRYVQQKESYTIAVTNLPQLFEKYKHQYMGNKYFQLALGFHPELVYQYSNQQMLFKELINETRFIGEIGLDYTKKSKEDVMCQTEIFEKIIKWCSGKNKILSVHSRSASKKVVDILNGFGRIGRLAFRQMFGAEGYEVVAINDLTSPKMLAHLLKYDSAQGRYEKADTVVAGEDSITVDGKTIKIYAEKDAANLPWGEIGVDVVLECTGFYTSKDKAQAHIDAGAKKVVISAPAGNDLPTIVYGVNEKVLSPEDKIISAASCTTNCLAPMAKALNDYAPIQSGIMTTVHAYTGDQMLLDGPHRKGNLRRARAAAVNIVPNSTGAAKAIGLVIPELNGKLIGSAQRVPVPTGSTTILVAVVKGNDITEEAINKAMKAQSSESFGYTDEELVSSDVIGMRYGSLFDSTQTMVTKIEEGLYQVQVVSWYDNENSYTSQMVRTIKYFAELG